MISPAEEIDQMLKVLNGLLRKVNLVTTAHRNNQKISRRDLDQLLDEQVDVQQFVSENYGGL